jgi:hypothetical protein
LNLKECRTLTQKVVCELGCVREALDCGIHKAGIPSVSVQFRQIDKPRNRSVHSQVSQTKRSRLY